MKNKIKHSISIIYGILAQKTLQIINCDFFFNQENPIPNAVIYFFFLPKYHLVFIYDEPFSAQ